MKKLKNFVILAVLGLATTFSVKSEASPVIVCPAPCINGSQIYYELDYWSGVGFVWLTVVASC